MWKNIFPKERRNEVESIIRNMKNEMHKKLNELTNDSERIPNACILRQTQRRRFPVQRGGFFPLIQEKERSRYLLSTPGEAGDSCQRPFS